MSEKIEALAGSTVQHGEAPHWDDAAQCLYYVDFLKDHVLRYNPLTGQNTCQNLGDATCSINIPRKNGGIVVSTRTDVAIIESWDTVKLQIFSTVEKVPNMLNDGKVDASGRLWIGSNYFDPQSDPSQLPQGQGFLYSVDADHTVKKHIGGINVSNGMAWTNDNRTMYYIDSVPGQMMAFDFDMHAGQINNKRTVTNFGSLDNRDLRFPDGMTIDIEGKLWVAGYDDGKIVRIDPQTGKVIRTVNFPVKRITSCCFGGRDFSDLYVTTSTSNMTPEELQKNPHSGSVFKVSGLGVKGRKANMFAG